LHLALGVGGPHQQRGAAHRPRGDARRPAPETVDALVPVQCGVLPALAVIGGNLNTGNAAIPAYCASKAGMLGAVRSMADRLGPDGIRVNAICPGFIETAMLGLTLDMPGVRQRFEESSVLKRIGQPSEIGEPAAFLLSDKASFITGQSIIVDGGVLATA